MKTMNTMGLLRRIVALSAVVVLGLGLSVPGPASAQGTTPPPAGKAAAPGPAKDDAHRREDIARHRQMARAHEDAARCLESGEREATCQERLRDACKGVGVGRYCGMRHSH